MAEKRTIVIGCDNAAVDLKKIIIKELDTLGYKYEDVGVAESSDQTLYPDVAAKVAKAIIASKYTKEGIILCGTGIGMAITANKFPGIIAAVCHDSFSTERSRLSNNANVMTMGARVIGPELAKQLVKMWLPLVFVPGSSSPKVDRVTDYERENFKEGVK